MGWGHSPAPVLEGSPAWEGLQWEKVGSLTPGSEFTLCGRRMGSLFCGELSAFGRHGTRSAWDAGMLTMETDGLSSLVLEIRSESGFVLFCYVFPAVSASVLFQLSLTEEVLGLGSAGRYAKGLRRSKWPAESKACEGAECGPGLNNSWPLAGPGGNPVLLCSGLE